MKKNLETKIIESADILDLKLTSTDKYIQAKLMPQYTSTKYELPY